MLSFVATQEDPASRVQKNLIDAAVKAGVKRFAPSEWSTWAVLIYDVDLVTDSSQIRPGAPELVRVQGRITPIPQRAQPQPKGKSQRYPKVLRNPDPSSCRQVLEYTLFQPGLFLNYLTAPHKSSQHVHLMELPIDFHKRRALVLDGGDNTLLTLTTVQDLANVVARAIDYEGEWPVVSGIRGANMSIGQLIALGEKIRGTHTSLLIHTKSVLTPTNQPGAPFTIEKLKADELASGTWHASWLPKLDHPSIPPDQVAIFSRIIVAGFLLAASAQAYSCTDEWNGLLPDYKFTQPEDFLSEAWRGKP